MATYSKPFELLGQPVDDALVANIDQMLQQLYNAVQNSTGVHPILSTSHSDATPATVTRGALITGQGVTPKWGLLAIGTSGKFPRSDGTDISWSQVVLTTDVSGTLPVTSGGTGLATIAQGSIIYGSASNVYSALAKDTNATRYLSNTGASNNPAWAQVALATGVSGTLPLLNGGLGFTTIVDGQLLYGNSAAIAKLSIGSSNRFLVVSAGLPNWSSWSTPNTSALVVGDIHYASTTSAMVARAIGASGDVLTVAGGVPTWAAPSSGGYDYVQLQSFGR